MMTIRDMPKVTIISKGSLAYVYVDDFLIKNVSSYRLEQKAHSAPKVYLELTAFNGLEVQLESAPKRRPFQCLRDWITKLLLRMKQWF